MTAVRVISNRIPELARQMQAMRGLSLTFGYQGDTGSARYASGITVAHNAAIQEFGFEGIPIPERPFLRRTTQEHAATIKAIMTRACTKVVTLQKDTIDAFTEAAIDIHGLFIQTLGSAQDWAVPNAPSTVLKKGHDVPLKGPEAPHLLLENLTWAIRINDKIVAEGR